MIIFRSSALLLLLAGCSSIQTGSAPSFGGPLRVEAHISGGRIVQYAVLAEEDTPVVARRALPLLEARILRAGHPMVDSLSGASITSGALKRALAAAQKKDFFGRLRLGLTMDKTRPPDSSAPRRARFARIFKPRRSIHRDILVVGGGAAGMAAALSAKEKNPRLSVALVEKLDILGGNAKFTRNLFDIVQSQAQLRAGIGDTAEDLYADTLAKVRQFSADPLRLRVFAEGSASLDGWLRSHDISLDYLFDTRGIMAGPDAYAGEAVMGGLEKYLEKAGVEVITGMAIEDMDFAQKIARGESREALYTIHARAIILTAGGFAANESLVQRMNPSLKGFGHSNSPGNRGDLLLIASRKGLPLDGMEYISIFNYGLPSRELTGDAEEGTEYILVNGNGQRFTDEYGGNIAQAIRDQPGSRAYLVFDEQTFQTSPRLRGHILKGRGTPAGRIGPDLAATLSAFNSTAADGGRRPLKAPSFLLEVRPLVHMTRGGLRVDAQSRLLDGANNPVPGFYAAGEVTDMIFAAFLGSLVFGIDAGKNAAASLD